MTTKKENEKALPEIKDIYKEAFPRLERKPMSMLRRKIKRGEYDLFVLRDEGRAVAFIISSEKDNVVMLDYLAVDNTIRSKGYGSRILTDVVDYYAGKRLFLVAEEVGEQYENNAQRIKRMAFYERLGWVGSNMLSCASSGRLQVLTYGGEITEKEFMAVQTFALGKFLIKLSKMHIEYKE